MLQGQFRSKRLAEENSQPYKLIKNPNGVLVFWHKNLFSSSESNQEHKALRLMFLLICGILFTILLQTSCMSLRQGTRGETALLKKSISLAQVFWFLWPEQQGIWSQAMFWQGISCLVSFDKEADGRLWVSYMPLWKVTTSSKGQM